MNEFYEWLDDKTQVISALTFIGCLAIAFPTHITETVLNLLLPIISGLLGIVVGKALKEKTP